MTCTTDTGRPGDNRRHLGDRGGGVRHHRVDAVHDRLYVAEQDIDPRGHLGREDRGGDGAVDDDTGGLGEGTDHGKAGERGGHCGKRHHRSMVPDRSDTRRHGPHVFVMPCVYPVPTRTSDGRINTVTAPRTHTVIGSPIGDLTLVNTDGVLSGLYMTDHRPAPDPTTFGPCTADGFDTATAQVTEYFDGTRTAFDLPLAPAGTAFQQTVWTALRAIDYGTTCTYGQIAAAIGRPTAVRAVAAANARNPLSIVVPCHRVIGSGGRLTGYAGGLDRKQFLLDREAQVAHGRTSA